MVLIQIDIAKYLVCFLIIDFIITESGESAKLAKESLALGNQILRLKEELAHLTNDRSRQRGKIRYFRNKITQTTMKTTDFTIDNAIQYIKSKLSPSAYYYFKVQIFTAKKPRWTEDSMDFALYANNCGKNVYATLSRMFRLPCTATIRRFEAVNPKGDSTIPSQVTTYVGKNNRVFHKNVFKKSPVKRPAKLPKLESKKNRTVAQILQEFLGKQEKEENESVLQQQKAEMVPNFVPTYVINPLVDSNMVVGGNSLVDNNLVVGGSALDVSKSLSGHHTIVSTEALSEFMDDANNLSSKAITDRVNFVPSQQSAAPPYINMKTLQMTDGTIEYMYDQEDMVL